MKYFLVYKNKLAYDQFLDGLNILNAWDKFKKFPDQLRALMCYKEDNITAELLKSMFRVILSKSGSNRRNVENRVIAYWNDYLVDCEGNLFCN